jgi:hypothetical protein
MLAKFTNREPLIIAVGDALIYNLNILCERIIKVKCFFKIKF